MIKEVKYNGYSAVPSDYECQDGDLALALNLIPEEGATLHPIMPPTVNVVLDVPKKIVYIHSSSSFRHFIVFDSEASSFSWFRDSEVDAVSLRPSVFHELTPSFRDMEVRQVNSIGNTLFFVTSQGIRHYLWRNETQVYSYLGLHPGFPEISFALGASAVQNANSYASEFDMTLEIPEKLRGYVSDKWFPSSGGGGGRVPVGPSARYASNELSELVMTASNAVFAGLNKFITDSASQHLFTEPFFIRYALRLFDGSHVMHSAPVLMVPNSGSPLLPYVPSLDGGTFKATVRIYHKALALFFRVLNVESLSDWKDIVTHVDFFISPPVYTYNQSGEIDPCSVSSRAVAGSLFSHYGVYSIDSTRAGSDEGNHRRPATNPIVNPLYSFPGGNYEHYLDTSSSAMMAWNASPKKMSEIEADVVSPSASLYYLVSSVEVGKFAEMDAFNTLDIADVNLLSLNTRQRLEDDYQSHHTLVPSRSHVYNSRLNLANVCIRPFGGFSLASSVQFHTPASSPASGRFANVFVGIRRNGITQWVRSASAESNIRSSLDEAFPRWLFYPDSAAFEMILVDTDGTSVNGWYRVPLSAHGSLEGSYWFRGLGSDGVPEKSTASLPAEISSQIPSDPLFEVPNKIYTSEVNNPFYFPLLGINTVGTGTVLGIASAAKALSQGQFGQFPLYAFSTDGVWALQVSESGSYSARQPITRDVCVNPGSITQIDSAVLFATDRGIMLISGSTSSCISDVLTSPDSFSLLSMPKGDVVAGLAGLSHDALETVPFLDFLKGCGMVYDYVNQRIIVFNSAHRYAYVYSMKSKRWGMMQSSIVDSVNAYPDALAMDSQSRLVNFSHGDADASPVKGLLVSRPIKLGEGDVLKTVDTVIQRGRFRKGHVRSILYGSRNLFDWHLISSSVDEFIRNIDGTPYKYFRVVALCELPPSESISGCTVQYRPRLTNRPR